MKNIQFDDVQGLVFSGYNKTMPCSSYYLLQITNPAGTRQWLTALHQEKRITTGRHRGNKWCLNLAISYNAFVKLGVSLPADAFEQAFQEGMNSPRRATVLGDQAENHPDRWQWGNAEHPVDLLLMLFSKDPQQHLERRIAEESAFGTAGLKVIERLDGTPSDNIGQFNREHFGFADGVSNPAVVGFPQSDSPNPIATGEFLFGYPNGYDGTITAIPNAGTLAQDFGNNGTYLVFRQLEQDVQGFWSFINNEAASQGIDPEWLAAKVVGRWKNGAVIAPGQTAAPQTIGNEFDFSDDPDGLGCPFGSHVRRANPRGTGLGETVEESLRVANRHLLLRRGRSYGSFSDDGRNQAGQTNLTENGDARRGLFFICLNANIERQFEFVQHTWINGIKFNGMSDEDDPLIGTYRSGHPAFSRSFTIPDQPLRRRIGNFKQFVAVRGGAYFFLPGIKALASLGQA